MAFELTPDRKAILDELLPRYPTKQALTIPLLHLCQEQNGYINDDVIAYTAKTLSLSTAEVQGVVTFYTLFMQKKVGRNVIWVCRTLSCELMGAREITECLEKKLGVHCGETTRDGEFTLLKAECLAACGQGPMIQLNDQYHENLTPEKLDAILDDARKRRDDKVKAAFSPVGINANPRSR
jgi:NADH-quinone oxidoreductase subunit E